MAEQLSSTATVTMDRAARYGKQLTNHLKRKSGGEWDAETESGTINLLEHRAEVKAADEALELRVEGPAEALEQLENVVGRHLVRFARDQHLEVQWQRSDGSVGSQQVTEPEEA